MKRLIPAVLGLLLVGTSAAVAQQDTSRCATTPVAGAKTSDLPKLLQDAACFAAAASSAIASQRLRLDKAKELAAAPPQPAPTPTPTPKPPVGDQEEPELGKDLAKQPEIVPANYEIGAFLTSGGPIPDSAKPDNVGAFRFICMPGHLLRDDPIVFPGQPGKSHLHQFFGNTLANAKSTYASLRLTGDSTCMNILNRSAYWIPAMLDGTGFVVRPDYVSIYYKRRPSTDPECKIQGEECVDLPRGLRYVFGYNMVTDTQPTGAGYYNCDGPTATPGHYPLLADAARFCGPGNRLGAVLSAPDCWDGKHYDSPDHRSHMAYGSYGQDGKFRCPKTHPKIIPSFTMGVWYSTGEAAIGAPGAVGTWSLSSDDMRSMGHGVMPAGATLHGDWFGAWDDEVLRRWHAHCINLLLNCSTGQLGNGEQMKQIWPHSWEAKPRLVPIPAVT